MIDGRQEKADSIVTQSTALGIESWRTPVGPRVRQFSAKGVVSQEITPFADFLFRPKIPLIIDTDIVLELRV